MKILNALVSAALLAVPAMASATTLLDGSFEIKGSPSEYCYDGMTAGGFPACNAGAWTGSGVITSGSSAWGSTTTPAGNYFGFVQGQQVMTQTFTATANAIGTLSWIDANRSNQGGLQSYVVTLAGPTEVVLGTYTSALGGFVARSSGSFALVAGQTYTLSFAGQTAYAGTSDSDRTSFIDNVVLTTAPVPEPATWAMLVIGFGLIGFASRRRSVSLAA